MQDDIEKIQAWEPAYTRSKTAQTAPKAPHHEHQEQVMACLIDTAGHFESLVCCTARVVNDSEAFSRCESQTGPPHMRPNWS